MRIIDPKAYFGYYANWVPRKAVHANIAYRRMLRRRCAASEDFRNEVYSACRRDLLFFVNAFCWIYEPREAIALPFITFPFQESLLKEINEAIGNYDLPIVKSRDMAASWSVMTAMTWRWQFWPNQSFLVMSRKEDLVDAKENPDSLFWKMDFLLKNQPPWMVPQYDRTSMHINNIENGSVIDGESTGSESGRGGRRLAILADEYAQFPDNGRPFMAATRDATRSRIWVSTPKGAANAFYEVCHNGKYRVLRLHWSVHPLKNRGLKMVNGKPTSPWYEEECRRAGHPMEIAQELDMDFLGSDFQYFDQAVLDRIVDQDVRTPAFTGELDFDVASVVPHGVIESEGGRLQMWVNPPHDKARSIGTDKRYVVGADISMGTGASNSALVVCEQSSGEQVAQFVTPDIEPSEFGRYAVAVCRFFNGAQLIWEANGGPGRLFGMSVWECGYRDVYYQTNERSISPGVSDTPGWYSTKEKKSVVMGELRRCLKGGQFVVRSNVFAMEARKYVYLKTGDVSHSSAMTAIDPSGARQNHGDVVIAAALACKLVRSEGLSEKPVQHAPYGSLAYRRERRQERMALAAASAMW